MWLVSALLEIGPVHPADQAARPSGSPTNEPVKHATESPGAELVAEFLDTLGGRSDSTRAVYGRTLYRLAAWLAKSNSCECPLCCFTLGPLPGPVGGVTGHGGVSGRFRPEPPVFPLTQAPHTGALPATPHAAGLGPHPPHRRVPVAARGVSGTRSIPLLSAHFSPNS